MRSLLLVAAAVAALAAGVYVIEWMPREAVAAASITAVAPAVHPQQIRSVRFAGRRLPLTILASHVATRVGDTLDAAVLDADRRALRDSLIARGYWATEVGVPDVVFGDDGGAHVTFRVDPGAIFHVRAVTIDGDATPGLAEALTLSHGDDVSPQRLARNAELLADFLTRHGRPGAQVSVETSTDLESFAVDVTFAIRRPSSRQR